jgi:hypothetical protein
MTFRRLGEADQIFDPALVERDETFGRVTIKQVGAFDRAVDEKDRSVIKILVDAENATPSVLCMDIVLSRWLLAEAERCSTERSEVEHRVKRPTKASGKDGDQHDTACIRFFARRSVWKTRWKLVLAK